MFVLFIPKIKKNVKSVKKVRLNKVKYMFFLRMSRKLESSYAASYYTLFMQSSLNKTLPGNPCNDDSDYPR